MDFGRQLYCIVAGAVCAILLLAMFPVCSVLKKKLEFGVIGYYPDIFLQWLLRWTYIGHSHGFVIEPITITVISVVPSTLWNSAGKFLHEIRWQWKLWHAVYMEAQFNRFTHSAILHLATSWSHGNPHPICRNAILAPESQPQSIRRSMQIPYIAEICTGIPFTEM